MSLQQQALNALGSFNSAANQNKYLQQFEQQTKIPKAYLAMGAVGVYFLMIILNIGGIGQLLANIATLVVPGYYSLVALETTSTSDDTQFLTYWVVYASFSVIEFWSKFILYWVPFYWILKTLFFFWLGLPQFGGATFVYQRFLRPFSHNVLKIHSSTGSNLKEQINAHSTGAHSTGARF